MDHDRDRVERSEIQRFTDESAARTSHLDRLATQIDRFEKNVTVLETRANPVLSKHALRYVEGADRPEEVSEHLLAEQISRLDRANQALEVVIDQISL